MSTEKLNGSLPESLTQKITQLKENYGNSPLLLILVGKSGAGKSAFAKAMDCPENHYEISGQVKRELKAQGSPINHDAVQPILHERYTNDHYWQIPDILRSLRSKKFLILDGPRSLPEVKRLKELHPNTLIVKVETPTSTRKSRLQRRDNTDVNAFTRIEEDETNVTGLQEIIAMADVTITNDGSLEKLQKTAKKIRLLLA